MADFFPPVNNGRLEGMPAAFKSRDRLFKERGEVMEELSGINPKLPLHAKLKKRLDEIEEQLGGQGAGPARKKI